MWYSLILFFLIALNLILITIARKNIKNSKGKITFIVTYGFLDGMFVWEDAYIIAFYNTIMFSLSIIARDIRWFLLSFAVFWLIRGMGETLYFFLQQFHLQKEFPHDIVPEFPFWKYIFGDVCPQTQYILSQVSVQMVSASALFAIILIILNWNWLEAFKWL